MSADLWKEFGPGVMSQASATSQDQPVIEDPSRGDDWGDFEEAKIQNSSVSQELPSDRSSAGPHDAPYTQFGRKINSEPLFDAETEQKSEQGQVGFSDHGRNPEPGRGSVRPATGVAAVNHLVTGLPQSPSDGIEENEDEEWADFEAPIQYDSSTHTSPPYVSSQKALSTLMDLPSTRKKDLAMSAPHSNSSSPEQGSLSTSPTKSLPPPSNIPPPSILLSLATSILPSLVANLKNLINLSTAAPRQDTHSVSNDQVVYHLSTLRAIVRIVAGRKHRWKRDTLLAQSVKIGPSHGGKAGGMKLAGVDKMEGRREAQEVAELVRAWRQHAGPLKASISKFSKMNMGQDMSIPEISENQNARLVKGALTAPKPCAICGLKRDERLEKVDFAVEDSFGEYWEEHWGHVDCKSFWSTYYRELQQR